MICSKTRSWRSPIAAAVQTGYQRFFAAKFREKIARQQTLFYSFFLTHTRWTHFVT